MQGVAAFVRDCGIAWGCVLKLAFSLDRRAMAFRRGHGEVRVKPEWETIAGSLCNIGELKPLGAADMQL